MNRKRKRDPLKNPFNSNPFEAVVSGSWQAVEYMKIGLGTASLHFMDNHHVEMMDKGPLADVRVRSRRATLSDCSSFLRPGIDICVLSTPQSKKDSDELNLKPVWLDAQISSIQRKPHDSECKCQFYVRYYVNQGSLGAELRTIRKETKMVGLNQISILQRLEHSPCENVHYRWGSSEDCASIPHTKMLLGKFLTDLSWLVIASVVRKVSFCARSVENKLVYQILESDNISTSLNTEPHISVLNFKVDDGGVVVSVVSQVTITNSKRAESDHEHEHEPGKDKAVSPSYNVDGLRRSKRRNVQPERYLGCNVTQIDVGCFRSQPPVKLQTWKDDKDDEMSLPLSRLFGVPQICPEGDMKWGQRISVRPEEDANRCKKPWKFNTVNNTVKELKVYNRRAKTGKGKLGDANKNEQQPQLAIVPLPDQDEPIAVDLSDLKDKVTRSDEHDFAEIPSQYHHLINSPRPKKNSLHLLASEPQNVPAKSEYAEKSEDVPLRHHYSYSTSKLHKKSLCDADDIDLGTKWAGINSSKGSQARKHRPTHLRSRNQDSERSYYKDRTLNAAAYKDLINSYLKNMNTRPDEEETPLTDQWKQHSNTTSNFEEDEAAKTSPAEDAEEISELDMLWREMEVSLASCYLEETEGSNATILPPTEEKPKIVCEHDFRLDEQIGLYCHRCGFVKNEIRYIFPSFVEHSRWYREEKQHAAEDPEPNADEDDDFQLFSNPASSDEPISEENDNVWSLIPELRKKLHVHQKKAFEFLWRNIAGSTNPTIMEEASKKRGGCVISHTPGAGKTFLIIAFLVSYLKLFPGKRPLVLAPKTTLYTWYKEFIKWEIPLPVYLIHGRRTYRVFNQKKDMVFPGIPKPTEDVKHVLDCLEKIQKWHSQPSVLIMGYTSFLTLMREDSKFAHRRYMAKVLRESPGLLVLDEGHNPRSTKSRLRKCLMKVQTELRILLSGTLFQNNFCEYFNTLCLARPKFPQEVLKALDRKYKKKKKLGTEKARYLTESRARKIFLDEIAKKIDSNVGEERMQGLNMLRNVTNGFIDNYEGASSDGLPGLQIYTLLMNTTDVQHEILHTLHKKMAECSGYPLELELLITLGSIHPWLIKTAVCAEKFFSRERLRELDKCKFDLKIGSKVKFVLSLIYRVVKTEKVLIFCHNIAPVKLFIEYFEKYFGWQKGREVLALTGELELFERGRIMDKFEEPGGASKILLASITACAEGISLTAASRVIMLDSEWNPSKTKQAIARAFRPGQQKVVYVYQLLVTGSLEEDKYRRTTWKEWVSSMIFSEAFVEDPSKWQAQKIEDETLREMVGEDRSKSFHMIMKTEKTTTNK